VTLGSDHPHPLTRAALAVVDGLEGLDHVDHVDHLTANDEREFLRDARSEEYRAHIAALEPDLLVSAAYARIVPDEVLAIPKLGAINVHPSLLPDYRGVLAVWWALYEGQTTVGVTIHEMTVPVDTGPILAQASLDVTEDADPLEVGRTLGDLAQPLLGQILEQIRTSGRIGGTPQPEGGSYRSQPHKELHRLELDWSQPASELVRRDRIFRGSGNVPVLRWRLFARRVEAAGPTLRPPGSILRRRPRRLDIAAGEGTSVRIELERPLRAWAKLLLLHLSTGRLSTLSDGGSGTSAAGVASKVGHVS
jgi:methionyl-tRNA formyltransferase